MTPRLMKHEPTAGALRAARAIQKDPCLLETMPEVIDRETGVRELVDMLEDIISQAGDLIEGRSPELVAQSRAMIRRFGDETPRQAE
jgi:hypothetical protein